MDISRMEYVFMDDLNINDIKQITDGQTIECDENDFFTNVLILFGVLQFSLLISMLLVSKFVYKPMLLDDKKLVHFLQNEIINEPYEYRYNLKNVTHENDDINPNSYICDTTPNGMVFMKYDKDEEGFLYWADKSIKFVYLDTVARKYAKSFMCRNFYIQNGVYDIDESSDSDDENETAENDVTDSCDDSGNEEQDSEFQPKQEKENEPIQESVFLSSNNNRVDNKPNNTSTSNKNTTDNKIVRNKFIHKGKICEFEILKKYEPREVTEKKKMTFDTFKDLFYGKKD